LKRDFRASISRPEIATGKAADCLGMGFGGRELAKRVAAVPGFFMALASIFPKGVIPVVADVLIRDASGAMMGAVDVTGDEQLRREGVLIVEVAGRMQMLGMVEAHCHLIWPSNVERVINGMKLPIEEHMLVTTQSALITLDHGFTSAYSAGSLGECIEPVLRDMIDARFIPGPRLRASALEKGAEGVMDLPEGHEPIHDRDIPGLRHVCEGDEGTGVRHNRIPAVVR
jgi:imidazolonepropionase-like amidohydrolase